MIRISYSRYEKKIKVAQKNCEHTELNGFHFFFKTLDSIFFNTQVK